MANFFGYKLVLKRLGDEDVEIPITDHGRNGAPTYTQHDCRTLAARFMGTSKSPWQLRRNDLWSNGSILLGIYPYYPKVEPKEPPKVFGG